mmetsp:Transcript_29354/g.33778  ORF Transcript_29354/g.33778 Transcript_29354/m.33778 type:complete len:646 (+) Transcript_29354:268-2205(+)|eukprot:CAMPEP_0194382352 /NCGR_PEP_ID=MMETSP0174-20130528/59869_1 /TAXON_ID=216777 /ORGANISM="Proboscia alata, Strain PI-D3" /LENGTH=645 /DNA_ID=CAMNT_0039167585 /DNA_START=227 /DNA_END=2164 /DNA_ORIENTATION=-
MTNINADSSARSDSYVAQSPLHQEESNISHNLIVASPSNNDSRYSIDCDESGNNESKAIPKKPSIPKNTTWNTTENINKLMLSPSNAIREALASISLLTATKLEETWDEVGYPPEDRGNQLAVLLSQIQDLCDGKVQEEREVADQFRRSIASAKDEMRRASRALEADIDLRHFEQQPGRNLIDQMTSLEETLESLRVASSSALSEISECKDELVKMNQALGVEISPTWLDVDSDLTQQRRDAFHNEVSEMREVMETRTSAVCHLLRDCHHLIKELRIDVEDSSFDDKIVTSLIRDSDGSVSIASILENEKCTGIGASSLEKLTRRVSDLSGEKRRRKDKLAVMGGEIAMLWEKLHIPEAEQRMFAQSVKGLGLDTIEKGEKELKRLHELKAEMMGNLILDVRVSIEKLWDEIKIPKDERERFEAWKVNDDSLFTEDLLAKHEEHLQDLRNRLNQMRPILKLIEKREDILKERTSYEEIQKDSNRLQQRGSALTRQLLQEEKMNKRIKRELPKVTDALEKKLIEWKKDTGTVFLYNGVPYTDAIARQEEEWRSYKDAEAQIKLMKKQNQRTSDTRGSTDYKLLHVKKKFSDGSFCGKKKVDHSAHERGRVLSDSGNIPRSKSRSKSGEKGSKSTRARSRSRPRTKS